MVVAHSPRPPPWPRNFVDGPTRFSFQPSICVHSIQAGRPKRLSFLGHLFFNIINVFCAKKTGGACLYMPQDGHGLASFAVIPPPKKLVFPPPKKFKFPIENPKRDMRTPTFEKQISDPFFFLFLFRLFLSAILSRRCRLSRTTSDPAQKVENIRPKLRFSCFSGENFGTILSRRSRLSRTSRAPSRLSRPRPIDCDAGPKRTVKIFPVFGQFIFRTSSKKVFSKGPASSGDLHPKRSP